MSKVQTSNLKLHFLLLAVSLFILLFSWFSTVNIPYWWDSAGYVISGAKYLLDNNFTPLVIGPAGKTIAHPPFFIALLALFWKVFGESLFVSHLLNLIFSILIIVFISKIPFVLIKNHLSATLTGFFSSILFIFTPLFQAQLGIVYLELPMVAFSLGAIYMFLQGRYKYYLVLAALAIITKETALYIFASLVGIKVFLELRQNFKANLKPLIHQALSLIFIPLIPFLLWLIYHFSVNGWFFIAPGQQRGIDPNLIPVQLNNALSFTLFEQSRLLITITTVFLLAFLYFKKKGALNSGVLYLLGVLIATPVFYGVSEFLHRYVLIALPILYILFFFAISAVLSNKSKLFTLLLPLILTLVFSFWFYKNWDLHRQINNWHFPPLEENLEYLDIVKLGKNLSEYLQVNYPNEVVYTTFPYDYMLSQPYQGYTKKPMQVKHCRDYKKGEPIKLMVFHFLSPEQPSCARLTESINWPKAYKFEKNGKFLILYINEATSSGKETEKEESLF